MAGSVACAWAGEPPATLAEAATTAARIVARLDRWIAEVTERPLLLRENANRLWSVDEPRRWLAAARALCTDAD